MQRQHVLGCAIILGTLLDLSLMAVGVMDHPASVEGFGSGLLRMDIALLLVYGIAGVVFWTRRASHPNSAAAIVGARIGLLLGAVLIANHLIEAFVPISPFVLIISPISLMLALLGSAGATAWERTKSLVLAVTGGLSCAIVATLIGLSFAISFNLFFAARVDWQLREAFAASGMIDPGGFRVRNILEASSEFLVRMGRASRPIAIAASFLAPLMFAAGASALWHANAIQRAARPPFVMSGVLLSGVALCAVHPILSILRGYGGNTRGSVSG